MKNPISNLMYDWITVLQSKAEGINAYDKYLKDAQAENAQECVELLNRLRDQDVRMVEEVLRHVKEMFGEEGEHVVGLRRDRSARDGVAKRRRGEQELHRRRDELEHADRGVGQAPRGLSEQQQRRGRDDSGGDQQPCVGRGVAEDGGAGAGLEQDEGQRERGEQQGFDGQARDRVDRDLLPEQAVSGEAETQGQADPQRVERAGGEHRDAKHGDQFQVETLLTIAPATLDGLERYLGSGMVPGVGPAYAKRIVEAFGDKTLEVLDQSPERLGDVPGLGPKRADAVTKAWAAHRASPSCP